MHQDQRGLRFRFNADAEVRIVDSPTSFRGRVTEMSLRGCFLETPGSFTERQRLVVRIFNSAEYFESRADVIYVKPSGVGVLFAEMNPHFRVVLQKWILTALDHQAEEVPAR
ncbi:MAG TPA: PilZ domain-containing protein [Candidatus Acidoferrum sp.]|nr:PilZ domain-containing protein [Candidatus Acidoferrum sp.]